MLFCRCLLPIVLLRYSRLSVVATLVVVFKTQRCSFQDSMLWYSTFNVAVLNVAVLNVAVLNVAVFKTQ